MAWTNLTFPFGSLLTSTKMTQLDANLDALAAQDSGSPALKTNVAIFNVTSTDAVSFTTLSFKDLIICSVFIPTGANTMVIMNRHSYTLTTGSIWNHSRMVSSGSWVISTVTSVAYDTYPTYAFETAYMDVTSIRGSNQNITIQVKGVGGAGHGRFHSSTIYFE